jgi:biopolymer transport protein TolQ
MDVTTLILKADLFIKLVLLLMLVFSVISWAVFFSKFSFLKKTQKESELFYSKFRTSRNMEDIYIEATRYNDAYLGLLYSAGYTEIKELTTKASLEKDGIDNVERAMIAKRDNIVNALSMKISFLATVGSSTPFIGLLGTVWGIINSFRGLALQHNNTLSAVAPGIAEALIATAIGLLTAIPAVIFYNHITSKIEKIEQRSNSFINEFINMTYRSYIQNQQPQKVKGDKRSNGTKKDIQENVQ